MRIDEKYYGMDKMHFMDADLYDNKLLIYDSESRDFFAYNIDDELIVNLKILGTDSFTLDTARKIIRKGKDLYVIQNFPCAIFVFRQEEGIRYLCKIEVKGFGGRVKNAYGYKGKIWMFPTEINQPIAVYDMENNSIDLILCDNGNEKRTIGDIAYNNGKCVFMTLENSCDLVIFDLDSRKKRIVNTGINEYICGITIRNEEIILRTDNGKFIYSIDIEKKTRRILAKSNEKYEKKGKLIVAPNGTIIICPVFSDQFYYVDERLQNIREIYKENDIVNTSGATYTIGTLVYQRRIIVLPWGGNGLTHIRCSNGVWTVRKDSLKMKKKDYWIYKKNKVAFETEIYENDEMRLNEYLEMISVSS